MKTLTAILILLAFLESTIWPINLVLIIIILRSYIKTDATNYYLAFFMGLLVAILSHLSLGLIPAIFLILSFLTHLISRTPLSKNLLSVIPIVGIGCFLEELLISKALDLTPQFWPQLLIEILISLPLYLILKFVEERFIPQAAIKLKIK